MRAACTEPAPDSINEDLYRVGPGYALVLDGAGRYPGESGGCVHPVTWVVERLAEHIGQAIASDRSLTEVARQAITDTIAEEPAVLEAPPVPPVDLAVVDSLAEALACPERDPVGGAAANAAPSQ